jgi:hypothetical protein
MRLARLRTATNLRENSIGNRERSGVRINVNNIPRRLLRKSLPIMLALIAENDYTFRSNYIANIVKERSH